MNFDLQMKSQLYREFRARQSLGRLCFRQLFMTSTNYTDHSLIPIPFTSIRLPFPLHFFSICPPSSVLRRRHRSAFSFFLLVGNFHGECRTEKEPGMKFASELNSNYPDVSFARSPRSASSFFPLAFARPRPSLCATARCKKRCILERDGSGDRGGVKIKRTSVRTESRLWPVRDCHWNAFLVGHSKLFCTKLDYWYK